MCLFDSVDTIVWCTQVGGALVGAVFRRALVRDLYIGVSRVDWRGVYFPRYCSKNMGFVSDNYFLLGDSPLCLCGITRISCK